jgi:hypothetical protein
MRFFEDLDKEVRRKLRIDVCVWPQETQHGGAAIAISLIAAE